MTMTPEQIRQAVEAGYLAEDTANYMLQQQASLPPPAPALPPPTPASNPPQWEPGQPWVPGVGTAKEEEDVPFLGGRAEDALPQNMGAGGASGGGGLPWIPPQNMGTAGPPPMAEQSAPPPPLPPQGPVDPATLVMNRPPPVQGTEKPPARKPVSGVGGGPKAPPNPTSAYAQATMGNFDEQRRNLENRRDFEQVNASMRAAQMNEDLDALTAQDAQRAAQHKQYLQRSEAALADLNARADALSRGKVDPGHWISDDPMHAIAAVFLGMDSPVVQKMIDRDIQSQKDAYERNKDSYLARASNYGHLRELYKDDEMAANAARVLQIDRAQRKLAVMTASQQPEDISLKTQEAMTTLAQAREDADYKFKMSAYVAQQKAGAGAGGMPALFNSIFKGNADALRSAQEDYYKRNPQGNMLGFANEVAQASKGSIGKGGPGQGKSAGIYQNFVNAEAVEEAALRLKELHKEYGLLDPITSPVKSAQMRAEMDKLQRMLAPAAARMVHGGAATKEEIEAEKEGMSGHWDPVGTRQKSLDVVVEDARRRKSKLAAGLQQGFGSATERDDEDEEKNR